MTEQNFTQTPQDGSSQTDAHSVDTSAVEAALAELQQQYGFEGAPAHPQQAANAPSVPNENTTTQQAEQTTDAVEKAVDEAIAEAQSGDDSSLQRLLETVDETTLDEIFQKKRFDFTRIKALREWQSRFDKQIAEERRRRKALEAQLKALQEKQALQKRLQEAQSDAERARILEEYAEKKAEEPIQQAQFQAALERLREWDNYYQTEMGVPPQVINEVSTRLISELRSRNNGQVPLDEFHRLRDSAIRAIASQIPKQQQHAAPAPSQQQQPQQHAAPMSSQQQQPAMQDVHNPDVTVTPGQGLAGEVSLEELWARGDFETLSKRIRDMARGG